MVVHQITAPRLEKLSAQHLVVQRIHAFRSASLVVRANSRRLRERRYQLGSAELERERVGTLERERAGKDEYKRESNSWLVFELYLQCRLHY